MTATHAAMSAKTYGMRGLLTMIFNVALTDDDGNAAGNGGPVSDAQLLELQELLQQKPPINEKSSAPTWAPTN